MTTLFGFHLQPWDVLAMVALPFAFYVIWLGESMKRAAQGISRDAETRAPCRMI